MEAERTAGGTVVGRGPGEKEVAWAGRSHGDRRGSDSESGIGGRVGWAWWWAGCRGRDRPESRECRAL